MRLAALALAACAHTQPPPAANPVRDEIERADAAERARHHEEARTHYERAVSLAQAPADREHAHREYAEMLAQWGELEAARDHFEAAIAAAPANPIAWQELGIVRNGLGDVPGAFAALEKSKQLAPRAWIPRRDLAVLHWKLGQRAEALAEYRAMLELELPPRLREKVQWAIDQLTRPPPSS